MKSVFGLPTHVLVVHLPVVLIPAVAAAAIVLAWWPRAPAWFQRTVLGLTLGVLLATWMATASGHAFDEVIAGRVPTEKHRDLGQMTLWLVTGLVGATGVLVGWRSQKRTEVSHRGVGILLGLATSLVALLSVVWVVRTGHEGARITWDGVISTDSAP